MSSSKREKLSGSVNLTPKERKIIIACMNATTGDIGKVINFEQVAKDCEYKNAENARTMFMRLKRTKFAETIDDTEIDANVAQPVAKAAPKRARKRKTDGEGPKPAAKRGKKTKSTDQVVDDGDSNAGQEATSVDENANFEVKADGTDNGNGTSEELTDALEQDSGHDSDATIDESAMQLDSNTEGTNGEGRQTE